MRASNPADSGSSQLGVFAGLSGLLGACITLWDGVRRGGVRGAASDAGGDLRTGFHRRTKPGTAGLCQAPRLGRAPRLRGPYRRRGSPAPACSRLSVIPGTAALGLGGPGPHPRGVADMEYDAKDHHELWRRTAHPSARPAPGLGRGQRCWPVKRRLAGGTTADRRCAVTGSASSSDPDSGHLHIFSCI